MLLELGHQLGRADYNIRIMAIATGFVDQQYLILKNSGTLVNIEFANIRKLISLDNRRDVKGQIETLFTKNNKDINLLSYHILDPAIF